MRFRRINEKHFDILLEDDLYCYNRNRDKTTICSKCKKKHILNYIHNADEVKEIVYCSKCMGAKLRKQFKLYLMEVLLEK